MVNIHAAKTQLSRLVEAAAAGRGNHHRQVGKTSGPHGIRGPLTRVLLDTHVCCGRSPSRAAWTRRPEPDRKRDAEMLFRAASIGRSRSKPGSAAQVLPPTPPRSPEPHSIPGSLKWPFARTRLPSLADYRCCTTIHSTAFSWRRRLSSLPHSTRPIRSSCLIQNWSGASAPFNQPTRAGTQARLKSEPEPIRSALPLVGKRAGTYRRERLREGGEVDARRHKD